MKEFLKNTQALRVIQTCTGSVRGNCRRNDDLEELDEKESAPLSRRPGHQKTKNHYRIKKSVLINNMNIKIIELCR